MVCTGMSDGVPRPEMYFLCWLHVGTQWGHWKLLAKMRAYWTVKWVILSHHVGWPVVFLLHILCIPIWSLPHAQLLLHSDRILLGRLPAVLGMCSLAIVPSRNYNMVLMGFQACGSVLWQAGIFCAVSETSLQKVLHAAQHILSKQSMFTNTISVLRNRDQCHWILMKETLCLV